MDEALFPEDAAAFPEAASWLRYDVAEAKKLLAAAGYADGVKTTAVFTPRYGQVYQFLPVLENHLQAGFRQVY